MFHNKKGFTLIEMLVVISIIAVLVAVMIPIVSNSSQKAKAATDAANLRTVLGVMNAALIEDKTVADAAAVIESPGSVLHDGAQLYVLYCAPGFVDVYYVQGTDYYGLEYLSELATKGESAISTAKPDDTGCVWYQAGTAVTE